MKCSLFCFCIVLILCVLSAFARGGWEVIENFDIKGLHRAQFLNSNVGWALTSESKLAYTSDGGRSWKIRAEIQVDGFHFIDLKEGWLAGSDGLRHTMDGGKIWMKVEVPKTTVFKDVFFINAQKGWAVGDLGIIIHTEDGGKNWDVQKSNTEDDLSRVQFISPEIGWVMGSSFVLRTTNGGRSWKRYEVGTWLRDMHFVDSSNGWVVSSLPPGIIYHTEDGGVSWKRQNHGIGAKLTLLGVHFVSPLEGWVVGSEYILHTKDGGMRWEGEKMRGILWDVYFLNSKEGWVVGDYGLVIHTSDGGGNWKTNIISYTLRDLQFVTPEEGWTVGYPGVILHTRNGGESWEMRLSDEKTWKLNDVYFLNPQRGWIATLDGFILNTEDGGQSWKTRRVKGMDSLIKLRFINANIGWMIGISSKAPPGMKGLFYTEDGGGNWLPRDFNNSRVEDIYFVDGRHGWVSTGTRVYRAVDGGKNWEPSDVKVGVIHSLYFITPLDGWGISWDILHTKDGGKSWKIQSVMEDLPMMWEFYDVCFANRDEGWAVGGAFPFGNGRIFHTKNGGETWEEVFQTDKLLRAICYTGGNSVIAVGDGIILKYTDPNLRPISVEHLGERRMSWGKVKLKERGSLNLSSPAPQLFQNYPNPFNLETWIPFRISEPSYVIIRIYDVNGSLVREIKAGHREAGVHMEHWDGRNEKDEEIASGTYFYILQAGKFKAMRKMVVVK